MRQTRLPQEIFLYLLIGSPSPGDEHDVEAGEATHGDDEKTHDDHDHDRDNRLRGSQFIFS